MKFTIDRTVLFDGINKVQRIVERNPRVLALKCVLLEVTKNGLKLTTTDFTVTAQYTIKEIEVARPGKALISVRFLSDLLRKLSGNITLETIKNKLQLGYDDDSIAFLNAENPDDFVEIPKINNSGVMEIPGDIFKLALKKTLFAMAKNIDRPVFESMSLKTSEGKWKIATTDGHRLALFKGETSSDAVVNALIPDKAVRELSRLLKNEPVKIGFTQHEVVFEFGNILIISRLIEGGFPNYEAIIPKESLGTIEVSKSVLKRAIERASLFTQDGYSIVSISGDNILEISGSSTLFGELKERIKVEHSGEKIKVYLNGAYFLQALNAMSGEQIKLQYNGSIQALKLQEENFTQLLLPVRG